VQTQTAKGKSTENKTETDLKQSEQFDPAPKEKKKIYAEESPASSKVDTKGETAPLAPK